ncbi:response regulator transcription factor [Salinisphaera japonica]|uniref:Chemotaxis protein CheY n=1 Tax=Salinisphaera japonica YTM-1 TaxID=1209778 RepID=A0A423PFM4_9GAMM|nr:response regulator [Salinisphaera japonica]ROO24392.1 chemotaxis protein CheY [Salinisphaera japonica YTM-1]
MKHDLHIHIVDDDASVRESLKALVRAAGYNVTCYASGKSLIDHVGTVSGCVILDLRLADMDGLVVQRTLIQEQVDADVIIMSAYGDIAHAVEAMRLGAVDFVEKPFDPETLIDRLATLEKASDDATRLQRDARQRAALIDTLTPREKQVLSGIVDGQANKEVASALGISARTVETHRVHIMQKLQANSLAHLVRIWMEATPHHEQAIDAG